MHITERKKVEKVRLKSAPASFAGDQVQKSVHETNSKQDVPQHATDNGNQNAGAGVPWEQQGRNIGKYAIPFHLVLFNTC